MQIDDSSRGGSPISGLLSRSCTNRFEVLHGFNWETWEDMLAVISRTTTTFKWPFFKTTLHGVSCKPSSYVRHAKASGYRPSHSKPSTGRTARAPECAGPLNQNFRGMSGKIASRPAKRKLSIVFLDPCAQAALRFKEHVAKTTKETLETVWKLYRTHRKTLETVKTMSGVK